MNREEAFEEINRTQDYYIEELVSMVKNAKYEMLKTINFTSDTGTGKTKMMGKLINKFPDYYFIITTLSKSRLYQQTERSLKKDCPQKNYEHWRVYGTASFKSNSRLQAEDIINAIPQDKKDKVIWLRDEGHIATNKFDEVLLDITPDDAKNVIESKCYVVINISATNSDGTGIKCDFSNTMMLRTVNQKVISSDRGPLEAIDKLIEVQEQHKKVPHYNPCAIFRLVSTDEEWKQKIIDYCDAKGLKHKDIINEDADMTALCKDDCEIDVIFSKYKLVEGIDIKRAHILYLDNQPGNMATTIQAIGRCRRNALLYRKDIDIFAPENEQLLKDTRECYVYFNTYKDNQSDDPENDSQDITLEMALCPFISCQRIKPDTIIEVDNGQLANGLYIEELMLEDDKGLPLYNPPIGLSGKFKVVLDEDTQCNILEPLDKNTTIVAYQEKSEAPKNYVYFTSKDDRKLKCDVNNLCYFPKNDYSFETVISLGYKDFVTTTPYYNMDGIKSQYETVDVSDELLSYFKSKRQQYVESYVMNKVVFKAKKEVHYQTHRFWVERTYKDINDLMSGTTITITKKDLDDDFDVYDRALEKIATHSEKKNASNMIQDILKALNRDLDRVEQELTNKRVIVRRVIRKKTVLKYVEPCGTDEAFRCSSSNKVDCAMYNPYNKIMNDKESAILGMEFMHSIEQANISNLLWVETKSVSSKISSYCKFNKFIQSKYSEELKYAENFTFNGKNNFGYLFDAKANSMLGYCVEYYSKYLIYGETYLFTFIDNAKKQAKTTETTPAIIVKACIDKYRANMMSAFGTAVNKVIKSLSLQELIQDDYLSFVDKVVELGTATAEFVKSTLYANIDNPVAEYDPNLSIQHITGLADYITEDTILDIKTTNSIGLAYVRQVLAYHYLSTKRSDLNIKRVIVYDAVSGQSVTIPISEKNIKQG